MGMFDHVEYKGVCPECGEVVRDWQTKDGECAFETLRPEQVRSFYNICPKCQAWLEATVKVLKYRIDLTATPRAEEEIPQDKGKSGKIDGDPAGKA